MTAAMDAMRHPGFRGMVPPITKAEKWRFDVDHDEKLQTAIARSEPMWPIMHRLTMAAQGSGEPRATLGADFTKENQRAFRS